MPLLPPWHDHELHNNIVEALKRKAVADEAAAHAYSAVDNQYLRSLEHSDERSAAQANAVLALLGLPSRHGGETPADVEVADATSEVKKTRRR